MPIVSSAESLMEEVAAVCQTAYLNGVPAGRIQYLMECEAETWEAVANGEIAVEEVEYLENSGDDDEM